MQIRENVHSLENNENVILYFSSCGQRSILLLMHRRSMAEMLPIRRNTLSNQSI